MRNNMEGIRLADFYIERGAKGAPHIQTLAGALTLDGDTSFVSYLDPGGATRVVTLPDPTTEAEKNSIRIIVNTADAAEDLTINDPASTTRGTISQNEMALILCDGVRHYVGVMTTT